MTPSDNSQFNPSQGSGDRLRGQALLQAMSALLSDYTTGVGFSSDQKPYDIQVKVIDLSTARTDASPERIGFPFKSYFVVAATSSTASASLKLHSRDTFAQPIPLALKDSAILSQPVREAYIINTAQAGATMTILFSVTAEFRSGSQISTTAGGVSISFGDTATAVAKVAVTTGGVVLFAADTARKLMLIQNQDPVNAIYIGGVGVTLPAGASPGIRVGPFQTFNWESTAACSAIAEVATVSTALAKFK